LVYQAADARGVVVVVGGPVRGLEQMSRRSVTDRRSRMADIGPDDNDVSLGEQGRYKEEEKEGDEKHATHAPPAAAEVRSSAWSVSPVEYMY
jgi:hypothetical protein